MIPVPIIDHLILDHGGAVDVGFACPDEPYPGFRYRVLDYRMVNNDPTRLEPVE